MTGAVLLALVPAVGRGVSGFLGGLRSRVLGPFPVLAVSQACR